MPCKWGKMAAGYLQELDLIFNESPGKQRNRSIFEAVSLFLDIQ